LIVLLFVELGWLIEEGVGGFAGCCCLKKEEYVCKCVFIGGLERLRKAVFVVSYGSLVS
jgi:hypothetical protein